MLYQATPELDRWIVPAVTGKSQIVDANRERLFNYSLHTVYHRTINL